MDFFVLINCCFLLVLKQGSYAEKVMDPALTLRLRMNGLMKLCKWISSPLDDVDLPQTDFYIDLYKTFQHFEKFIGCFSNIV